jgi:hypothetical protein
MTDVPFACQEQLAALEAAIAQAEQALLLVAERGQIFADCMDEHSEEIPGAIVGTKADPIIDNVQNPVIAVCDRLSAARGKINPLESRLRLFI